MSIYLNADCMNPETGLPSYPDKHFDLAIVDPPYGIGAAAGKTHSSHHSQQRYTKKDWDNGVPDLSYFQQLFRVSKNQIVCGGNYFANNLPQSSGWIYWDKDNHSQFSDGELLWSSFDVRLRAVRIVWNGFRGKEDERFHPTQKPMALYRWLVQNYAKQGDLILDTHAGSASSLVVYEEMGFEYVGFELDADYYRDSCKRLEAFRAQPKLFSGKEIFEASKPATLF